MINNEDDMSVIVKIEDSIKWLNKLIWTSTVGYTPDADGKAVINTNITSVDCRVTDFTRELINIRTFLTTLDIALQSWRKGATYEGNYKDNKTSDEKPKMPFMWETGTDD